MVALARIAYRFLLTIHPTWFRDEFGQEMLWIFDEQVQSGSRGAAQVQLCSRLLLDALCSAFVQLALRGPQAENSDVELQFLGPMLRIVEGSYIAFSCLLNLLSIVGVLAALVYSR